MMNTKPLVSVVTVTYNNGAFLKETISSVLAQTFRDFEYIIWDDGSTDDTKMIVESFSDQRIRYFYGANQGVGPATIEACKRVRGDYIARLDGDDVFLPEKLEKQIAFFNNNPRASVIGCSTYIIDTNSKIIGVSLHYCSSTILMHIIKNYSTPLTHSCSLFKTEDFLKVGGYPSTTSALDGIIWTRFKDVGPIINMPDILVKYRVHGPSITAIRTQGPYKEVIASLLKKIKADEGRDEFDNQLYNILYKKAKEWRNNNLNVYKFNRRRDSKQTSTLYRFVSLFCRILGKKRGLKFIFAINDLVGRIKYGLLF